MTVAELIEELKLLPQTEPVGVRNIPFLEVVEIHISKQTIIDTKESSFLSKKNQENRK